MDDRERKNEHPQGGSPPDGSTAWMRKERTRKFGSFRVELRLGQGGMGTVYLCKDLVLHRFAAVKVLREDLRHDPRSRKRFLEEARAIARVSHPNVVQIYQVSEEETPYFAMEYVQGASLSELLRKKKRFQVAEALDLVLQAARGLRALNEAGIVHRDVKPGNILVTGEGKAKIVDFGLAFEEGGAGESGMVAGTPQYIAPEQVEGTGSDLRADIYGLGATFFHMVTGEPPFAGASGEKLLALKLAGDPPGIRESCRGLPRGAANLLEQMLKRRRGERPGTYEELILRLERQRRPRKAGHLVVLVAALFCAAIAFATLLPSFYPSDYGDVEGFLGNHGAISVGFKNIREEGLRLSHFMKPVRPGGKLPAVTGEGLVFSGGSYELAFVPLELREVRFSGIRLENAGAHFKVFFGHPQLLYRSFSVSFRSEARGRSEAVFRAVRYGKLAQENMLVSGRGLQSSLAKGFDLVFSFPGGRENRASLKVKLLFEGREIEKQLQLPVPQEGENWREGVAGIKVTGLPMKSYKLLLSGIKLTGRIHSRCLTRWISGNELWRRLW